MKENWRKSCSEELLVSLGWADGKGQVASMGRRKGHVASMGRKKTLTEF